MDKAMIDLI